ncbi:unnamed protein product [Microthlaspi erraticum]|uniref:Uncharacterized protein n=1 Tax=Microthlaspi erraticum TaxID=1685480 RepID=A0A6D2HZY2_9BRAS|nr:unnamed protein product [Microthlaspi erraticum]
MELGTRLSGKLTAEEEMLCRFELSTMNAAGIVKRPLFRRFSQGDLLELWRYDSPFCCVFTGFRWQPDVIVLCSSLTRPDAHDHWFGGPRGRIGELFHQEVSANEDSSPAMRTMKWRIRQLSLASNASLKLCISKPRPPELLDFFIFVQEVQLIFCTPGVWSHQKRVRADWIRLQRLTGILKHDIE